ncbi:helix-turn-helix transcriptional regulator [Methylobacterium sp. E-045]|uniref:helix-turn-helix transcriptional regulator n=1 Tax=Methylobacterium sp. E-045 TaxID=2836575 RepID=UPI001FB9766F|nr:helix-turn-helix transcriptional regulator [Methylobacterium sp. E-045]MCJ2127801.1 helix-turn-helix transcriptional regulator [Methylobacterium sp. E-045]
MSINSRFFGVLDRMGCGALLLDSDGDVVESNQAAIRAIQEFNQDQTAKITDLRSGFKSVLEAGGTRFRHRSESWIMVPRVGKRSLAIHAMPAGDEKDAYGYTLVTIVDLDENPDPSNEVMQKMFGLTLTESSIAKQICYGKTLAEIASDKRITLWTVRTHLASIFSKTQTRRQSDLMSLLHRITAIA